MGFILFFNLFLLHSWQHFFQLLFSCSCAQHRETPVVQQQVMPHAQGCWRHASASTPAMGILFPLGKEVLPLINQAEVCLLLQRTTANKALRKGGVVRAYLFKKKKFTSTPPSRPATSAHGRTPMLGRERLAANHTLTLLRKGDPLHHRSSGAASGMLKVQVWGKYITPCLTQASSTPCPSQLIL